MQPAPLPLLTRAGTTRGIGYRNPRHARRAARVATLDYPTDAPTPTDPRDRARDDSPDRTVAPGSPYKRLTSPAPSFVLAGLGSDTYVDVRWYLDGLYRP